MAYGHVVQAQTALANAGFYHGKIDGDFGGGAMRAVESIIANTGKAVDVLTKPETTGGRSMSAKGIALLKAHEGLRLQAYQDTGKVWTIGYGHTTAAGGLKVYSGLTITHEEAEQLLKDDLARMTYPVIDRLVKAPLTQGQFDALASFIFNLGERQVSKSTLLRLLNAKDYDGASGQFGRWVYDNGRKLNGLIKRRAAERELFDA